ERTLVSARTGAAPARRMQEIMERVLEEQSKAPADKKLKAEDVRLEVRKRYKDEMNFDKGGEQIVRLGANGAVRLAQAEPPPAPAQQLPPPVQPDVLGDVKVRRAGAAQPHKPSVEQWIRPAPPPVENRH